jgi:hypothetical protein
MFVKTTTSAKLDCGYVDGVKIQLQKIIDARTLQFNLFILDSILVNMLENITRFPFDA